MSFWTSSYSRKRLADSTIHAFLSKLKEKAEGKPYIPSKKSMDKEENCDVSCRERCDYFVCGWKIVMVIKVIGKAQGMHALIR